jgi:hypothetical protein
MRPRRGVEMNSELRLGICSRVRPTVHFAFSNLVLLVFWLQAWKSISDIIPGANPCRSAHTNYWIIWAVAVPALWYEQFPYPQLTMWEVFHLFTWLSNLHSFALAGKLGTFGVVRWWTLLHTARKFLRYLSCNVARKLEDMTVKL